MFMKIKCVSTQSTLGTASKYNLVETSHNSKLCSGIGMLTININLVHSREHN